MIKIPCLFFYKLYFRVKASLNNNCISLESFIETRSYSLIKGLATRNPRSRLVLFSNLRN